MRLQGVTEFSVSRLESYYEINPEKIPDVVYVDEQYGEVAKPFCELFEYRIDDEDGAIILVKTGDNA